MISRRAFAAGVALIPAAAWCEDKPLAMRLASAIQNAMAVLPAGPVLLNSFVVDTGPNLGDFDLTQANAAYVYDNALAGLALLAVGDRGNALRIGDALAIAQSHDRYWHDGRLRNAYQAGVMSVPAKLPGWWDTKARSWQEDPYQVGSQTGPVAWAMLLWSALGQADAANRAGNWLDEQLRASNGYYGGFYGFEPHQVKLSWQSTEQNTDLSVAFGKLSRLEDSHHAEHFVRAMFDQQRGVFNAGTSPSGTQNILLAADAGIWPYLAGIGSANSALAAIKSLTRGAGIGFSAVSSGTWMEGTGFAALALHGLNDRLAGRFMATIEANISPSGYIYASVEPRLSTGLTVGPSLQAGVPEQTFNYFRRPALAPTAWAVLAALDVNPLAR
ncbi:MAG: hypothetical protein P4L54_07555 [Acidocella sp.]|nr:hypothetical protein [Acidocella sp.]